jgi:RIO-like serine/threonine protein kinase
MKKLGELEVGDYLYSFEMKKNRLREYKEWPVEVCSDLFSDIKSAKIKNITNVDISGYRELYTKSTKRYIIWKYDKDISFGKHTLEAFGLSDHIYLYDDCMLYYPITNKGTKCFVTTSFDGAKDLMRRLIKSIEKYYRKQYQEDLKLISQYKRNLLKLKEPPHV